MAIKVRVDSDSLAARRDLDALKAAVDRIKNAANSFSFNPFSDSNRTKLKEATSDLDKLRQSADKTSAVMKTVKNNTDGTVKSVSGISANSKEAAKSVTAVAVAQDKVTQSIDKSTASSAKFGETSSKAADQIKSVAVSFGSLVAAAAGITGAIQLSDTLTAINSKLKISTASQVEFNRALADSQRIAISTRMSITGITDLYSKISRYTNNFSRSQRDVARVTETVAKAINLSGAGIQQADAAVLQLGQGLASGTLQGEELRSILENAPELARAIALGLGKSVGQLKLLGAEGKLLSEDVFKAILSQSDAIDGNFKSAGITFKQAFTNLGTSVIILADNLNRAFGSITGKGIPAYINAIAVKIAQFADNVEFFVLRTKLAVSSAIAELDSVLSTPIALTLKLQKLVVTDIFPKAESVTSYFTGIFNKVKEYAIGLFDFDKLVKIAKLENLKTPLSQNFSGTAPPFVDSAATMQASLFTLQSVVLSLVPVVAGFAALKLSSSQVAVAIKASIIAGFVTVIGKYAGALVRKDSDKPVSDAINANLSAAVTASFGALSSSILYYFAKFPGVVTIALVGAFKLIKLPGIAGIVPAIAVLTAKIVSGFGIFSGIITALAAISSMFKLKSLSPNYEKDSLGGPFLDTRKIIKVLIDSNETLLSIQKTVKSIYSSVRNYILNLFSIKGTATGTTASLLPSADGANEKSIFQRFIDTFKSLTGLGPYTGGGPQKDKENRTFGHDVFNTFVPEKAQIPLLASIATVIGAAVAALSSGAIRTVLLALVSTGLGIAVGSYVYAGEIKRFTGMLASGFVELIHKATTALFGSGIFGDKGFGGVLITIAKLALLFQSGREALLKGAVGALTAPTNIANGIATGFQSKVAERSANASAKELSKITDRLEELREDQKAAVKALATTKINGTQLGNAAARQLSRDSTLPVVPALSALASTARNATAKLELFRTTQGDNLAAMTKSTDALRKNADRLKEQVQTSSANFRSGFTNTSAAIGGAFGSLGGFNIGSIIADSLTNATDWEKVGIRLGSALVGQAILAGVGAGLASAFLAATSAGVGLLGTGIATAFGSGLFIFAAGAAALIAAVLNWEKLKPVLDAFIVALKNVWISTIIPAWEAATNSLSIWLEDFSAVIAKILNSKPFNDTEVPSQIKGVDTADVISVASGVTAAVLIAKWQGYFTTITDFFKNFATSSTSWRSALVGISLQFDLMMQAAKNSFPNVSGFINTLIEGVRSFFVSIRTAIANINIGGLARGGIIIAISTLVGGLVSYILGLFKKSNIESPEDKAKREALLAQIPTKDEIEAHYRGQGAAPVVAPSPAAAPAKQVVSALIPEINAAAEAINQAAVEFGINASYLAGLAKLETQMGAKTIKGGGVDTNNLFNIKAKSGEPGIAAFDKAEGSNDRYRIFSSYKDSVDGLIELLARRYPAALAANSPEEFAKALKAGGYATDPEYVSKLISVIGSKTFMKTGGSETRISRDMGLLSAEDKLFSKYPGGKLLQEYLPKIFKDKLVEYFGEKPTSTGATPEAPVSLFGKTLDDAINKINSVFGTAYSKESLSGIGKSGLQTIKDAMSSFEEAIRDIPNASGVDQEVLKTVLKQSRESVDSVLGTKTEPLPAQSFRDLLKTKDTAEGLALFNAALAEIGLTVDKATLDALDTNQYENLVSTLEQINKVTSSIDSYQGIAKDRVLKDLAASKEYVKKILDITKPGDTNNFDGPSGLAVAAGTNFATQFQQAFTTGLSDTLKGKISFKSFLDGLVDNFTSNVVTSFTTGFSNVIFKNLKIDTFLSDIMTKIFSFGEDSGNVLTDPMSAAAVQFQAAVTQFQTAVMSMGVGGVTGNLLGDYKFGDMPDTPSILGGGLLGGGSESELDKALERGVLAGNTEVVGGLDKGFNGLLKGLNGLGGSISNSIGSLGSLLGFGGGGSGGLFGGISKLFSGGFGDFDPFNLISFDVGGVIPGGFGQPVPIMAHGGEVVLNPRQQQEVFSGSSRSTSTEMTFNINVTGDISTQTRREIQQMIPQITSGVNATNQENNYKG